jgi:hypothetical protein
MVLVRLAKGEEHYLIQRFGIQYEQYREVVPRFIPGWQRSARDVQLVRCDIKCRQVRNVQFIEIPRVSSHNRGWACLTSPIFAADDKPSPGSSMGSGMMEQGGMMDMMKQMSQVMKTATR